MKVLVVGSTGASGRAVVAELLERGHEVTAFARNATSIDIDHPRFAVFVGDAMEQKNLDAAVLGHDAVVVTLGITENAVLVRLRGASRTPLNVRSAGTANVVRAMQRAGVNRLIVQTTYGVGQTRGKLPLKWRMIFWLFLKPQIEDTERQEQVVRESGLVWSLVQPVGLTNEPGEQESFVSTEGEFRGMPISRASVAKVIAETLRVSDYEQRSLAVSAA